MKFIKHIIFGIFISLFLASVAFADVYINPGKTSALVIGVSDAGTLLKPYPYNGQKMGLDLGLQFIQDQYNTVGIGNATSGVGGNMYWNTTRIQQAINEIYVLGSTHNGGIDNFIFYLNGHGVPSPIHGILTANDGIQNKGISSSQLKDYLSILNGLPNSLHKIVILDSCYSGGFIDELKTLENISILTSASASSWAWYDGNGISYFSTELLDFVKQNGEGFFFSEMVHYMEENFTLFKYQGTEAYELDSGDPITLTEDCFNIQTYQSPSYNTPVPIPAAIWLLGSGLIGLIGTRKKLS